MEIDLSKYEKACGPMRACQRCVELFINDSINNKDDLEYGYELYKWLGETEITVDELFDYDPKRGDNIYWIIKKYKLIPPDNTEYLENYGYAFESLEYQSKIYENILQNW